MRPSLKNNFFFFGIIIPETFLGEIMENLSFRMKYLKLAEVFIKVRKEEFGFSESNAADYEYK